MYIKQKSKRTKLFKSSMEPSNVLESGRIGKNWRKEIFMGKHTKRFHISI